MGLDQQVAEGFPGFRAEVDDSRHLFPQTAQGILRPMPESNREGRFAPTSGRWASAQVRHAAAEALRDVSEPLAAGCEEPAQKAALAQFFQPRLPGLRTRAQPRDAVGPPADLSYENWNHLLIDIPARNTIVIVLRFF